MEGAGVASNRTRASTPPGGSTTYWYTHHATERRESVPAVSTGTYVPTAERRTGTRAPYRSHVQTAERDSPNRDVEVTPFSARLGLIWQVEVTPFSARSRNCLSRPNGSCAPLTFGLIWQLRASLGLIWQLPPSVSTVTCAARPCCPAPPCDLQAISKRSPCDLLRAISSERSPSDLRAISSEGSLRSWLAPLRSTRRSRPSATHRPSGRAPAPR